MLIIRPGSVTSNSVVKHVKPKFLASPPTSTVVYLVCSQVMGSNLNPQLVSTEILSQDLPTSVIPPTSPSTSWHRFPGQGFSKIRPADFICKRAVWLILKKKSKKNTFIGIWHLPSSPPPGHPELFKGHNDTFLPPDSCICTCRDHLGCNDQSLRASVKAISTLSREKYQLVNTADTELVIWKPWRIPTLSPPCNLNLLLKQEDVHESGHQGSLLLSPGGKKPAQSCVTWFLSVHRAQNSTNQKAVLTKK